MSDKRLDKIDEKLSKIDDKLGSIDTTLAAQHVSLKEHMRRTELLEKEIRPIKTHVNMVQGAIALITILATIAGIIQIFR